MYQMTGKGLKFPLKRAPLATLYDAAKLIAASNVEQIHLQLEMATRRVYGWVGDHNYLPALSNIYEEAYQEAYQEAYPDDHLDA